MISSKISGTRGGDHSGVKDEESELGTTFTLPWVTLIVRISFSGSFLQSIDHIRGSFVGTSRGGGFKFLQDPHPLKVARG